MTAQLRLRMPARRPLLLVALLVLWLLQAVAANHPYSHDLADSGVDCAVCLHGGSLCGPLPATTAANLPLAYSPPALPPEQVEISAPRIAYRARGPPLQIAA